MMNPLRTVRNKIKFYRFIRSINRLKKSGMKVGENVTIMPGVVFDSEFSFLISIGNHCSISAGVRIMAHDATTFKWLGYTRLGAVTILDNVFIGERAILLPGITIGPHVLVAAGSVVNRDIPAGKIAAGNPARIYGNLADFLQEKENDRSQAHALTYQEFYGSLHNESFREKIKNILEERDVLITGTDSNTSYCYEGSPTCIKDKDDFIEQIIKKEHQP